MNTFYLFYLLSLPLLVFSFLFFCRQFILYDFIELGHEISFYFYPLVQSVFISHLDWIHIFFIGHFLFLIWQIFCYVNHHTIYQIPWSIDNFWRPFLAIVVHMKLKIDKFSSSLNTNSVLKLPKQSLVWTS